jgi:Pentapeptide repeats (8 copies)
MARGRHQGTRPSFRFGRLVASALALTTAAHKRPITSLHRATRMAIASFLVGLSVTGVLVLHEEPLASATTVPVTNCSDSGPGSFRSAVGAAAPGDTISFSVDCSATSPVTLASPIDIDTNLTIDGPGAGNLVLNGANLDLNPFDPSSGDISAISVSNNVTVSISGLTVENAVFTQCGFDVCLPGGGQAIENRGTLTVTGIVLSGDGQGITNIGTLTVNASTFSNTPFNGSAIANFATLRISDSTFLNNWTAVLAGEGVATISNSTLSGGSPSFAVINSEAGASTTLEATIAASSNGVVCAGAGITDGGYNLDTDSTCGFSASTSHSGVPSGLDPAGLQDNGGPTQTIALEPGSLAIGAVNSASLCSNPDQRGVARPVPCDIGAFQTTASSPQPCADFGPDADLQGCNLTSVDLADLNLTGANLFNADLTDANLAGATLTDANLTDSNLDDANLTGVITGGIVGTPSALPPGWSIVGGYLLNGTTAPVAVNLAGANLSGQNLTATDLSGVNLTGANLFNTDLTGADLSNAIFTDANLNDANLSDVNLTGVVSGGITGIPSALPSGWTLNSGELVPPPPV